MNLKQLAIERFLLQNNVTLHKKNYRQCSDSLQDIS
jgi:hypothetical protein